MRHFTSLLIHGCLLCALAGCATWYEPGQDFQLPKPRLQSDAVLFEVAFVRWQASTPEDEDQFWRSLDEQFLSAELRSHLTANGLRVGLVSGQLPETLRRSLESTSDPLTTLAAEKISKGNEMLARRERRQFRNGIREEIEVLPQIPGSAVVLVNEGGRVQAAEFSKARGVFGLTSFPQGDGRVRISLLPAFDYGEVKQRVIGIGHGGAFRFDASRDERWFDSLLFEATLAPGQTLIVTSTGDPKGIGATLFARRFQSSDERLILMIRLAQTQFDDLFAPENQLAPLVTPVE